MEIEEFKRRKRIYEESYLSGQIKEWKKNENTIFDKNNSDFEKIENEIDDKTGIFKPFFMKQYNGLLKDALCTNDFVKIFYPASSTCGENAMSSIVHLLVIPDPKFRMYNIIDFEKGNDENIVNAMLINGLGVANDQRKWIIDNIMQPAVTRIINGCEYTGKTFTNESFRKWLHAPSCVINGTDENGKTVYEFTLKTQKNWIQNDCPSGFDMTTKAAETWSLSPDGEIIAPEPDWVCGFHVHPEHSVNYLHMHIMDKNMQTNGSQHNYNKIFSVEDLFKYFH